MATLKCNSCGGNVSSGARRVQCPHCGELFPFACCRCAHKLRPPFSVFDDERYLTRDESPQPLCDEHYLRKCPDCDHWFGADENPGYFRCRSCAQAHDKKMAEQATWEVPSEIAAPALSVVGDGGVATQAPVARAAANAKSASGNALVIGLAVCALLALVGWMILGR